MCKYPHCRYISKNLFRDVNNMKYKIIMLELPEFKSLEIFVYNKPSNFLRKIFLTDEDFVDFAKTTNPTALDNEKALERLLLK